MTLKHKGRERVRPYKFFTKMHVVFLFWLFAKVLHKMVCCKSEIQSGRNCLCTSYFHVHPKKKLYPYLQVTMESDVVIHIDSI